MKTDLEKVTEERDTALAALSVSDKRGVKDREDRDIWIYNYSELQKGYNTLNKRVNDQAVVINESIRVHRLASEKIESLEIKVRELNAELLRLERKHSESESDAKANEMMLKQVCDERDALRADYDRAMVLAGGLANERDSLRSELAEAKKWDVRSKLDEGDM